MAAHPRELAVLQHVEQLGLQGRVELADLVQEDGSAVGELEAAGLALVGAGEGASLVAEQLALQQLMRHRRAVHLDEGGPAARRVHVDAPGHQLLADAGLAAHQHGDVGPRGLLDHLLDLSHLGADQQGQLTLQALAAVLDRRLRSRLPTGPADQGSDRGLEILGGVGPSDEVVGTGLDGLHDLGAVAGIGDHDDGPRLGQFGRPAHELDAGHPGQADRYDREGDARVAQQLERFFRAARHQRAVSQLAELDENAAALIRIALDEQRLPGGSGRMQILHLHVVGVRKRRAEHVRCAFARRRGG